MHLFRQSRSIGVKMQMKLASACEDVCRLVLGVMTWRELLEHMHNLLESSAGKSVGWQTQARACSDAVWHANLFKQTHCGCVDDQKVSDFGRAA